MKLYSGAELLEMSWNGRVFTDGHLTIKNGEGINTLPNKLTVAGFIDISNSDIISISSELKCWGIVMKPNQIPENETIYSTLRGIPIYTFL